MRATYSASTLGMHHMSFCQGLRWFSARRRRTVSRDEAVMLGQLDHRASQQLQRPAGAAFGRARTGGGDQQGLFVAGQLAIGARTRLLVQGGFEIAFHEAALGPVNGRAADARRRGNLLVADPGVGGEQNLGSFELAGGMLAAAQQRGEFTALGFAQFDMVAYVHPGLLSFEAQTNQLNRLAGVTPPPPSPTSRASTWPSSTPTAACSAARRPKPTCSGTSKSPHPVHQMVLTLERAGLIRRQPRVARSIELLVDRKISQSSADHSNRQNLCVEELGR